MVKNLVISKNSEQYDWNIMLILHLVVFNY